MTSDELRKLADEEAAIPAEYRTCDIVIDALRDAASEIDSLTARLAEATQILRRCRATCSPARGEEIVEFLEALKE